MPQSFYDRSYTLRSLLPDERKKLEAQKPKTLTDAIAIAIRIIAKGEVS
jgi:hypothetical protein